MRVSYQAFEFERWLATENKAVEAAHTPLSTESIVALASRCHAGRGPLGSPCSKLEKLYWPVSSVV
jgi:hypothetical protein